jgi:hypothetical protein
MAIELDSTRTAHASYIIANAWRRWSQRCKHAPTNTHRRSPRLIQAIVPPPHVSQLIGLLRDSRSAASTIVVLSFVDRDRPGLTSIASSPVSRRFPQES